MLRKSSGSPGWKELVVASCGGPALAAAAALSSSALRGRCAGRSPLLICDGVVYGQPCQIAKVLFLKFETGKPDKQAAASACASCRGVLLRSVCRGRCR